MMDNLSVNIKELLKNKKLIQNTIGCSSSKVYKIENLEGDRNGYIKIEYSQTSFGIEKEYEVYKFLFGKVKVPEIYSFEYPSLVTYEVEGVCSCNVDEDKRFDAVRIAARALKQLHSVDISECNLYSQFEQEIRGGKYSEEQLIGIHNDDYVFVHGDACLPNFIICNNEFNGFVDMGAAGIGNRYEDLAWCTWSTLYNFKDMKYVDEFFREYGEKYYQLDKIKLYLKIVDMELPL